MRFLTVFITIILFLPIIGLFLYMAAYPRESALWGNRWQFKNQDLEPSDEAIKYNRNVSIIMVIVMVIILAATIIKEL